MATPVAMWTTVKFFDEQKIPVTGKTYFVLPLALKMTGRTLYHNVQSLTEALNRNDGTILRAFLSACWLEDGIRHSQLILYSVAPHSSTRSLTQSEVADLHI